MLLILLGALLVVVGVVFLAAPPIWLGRLSGRRAPSTEPRATLEPRRPAAGFELATSWPGLALMVVGAALLLFGAF